MWKKIALSILALIGTYFVAHAYGQADMKAADSTRIGEVIEIGGEKFKIIKINKGDGPNGSDSLTALLMRFINTEPVYAGEAPEHGAGTGLSDNWLAGYAKDFEDQWWPKLTKSEQESILKKPYVLDYKDDFDGKDDTNPLLSNESLGVSGCWWIHYGQYNIDAVYVSELGKYSLSIFAQDKRNVIPAIRIKDKQTKITPNYADEKGTVIIREGEAETLNDSILANLESIGKGTIVYSTSGDSQYLELVENPTDNTKATIKVKQDLKEGTYALQVTTKDDEGDIATVTLNVTVLKAYPTIDDLQFIPSETITPDATTEDILGIASLNGISDTSQIKTEYSVDEASFTIENTSNLNLQMDSTTGELTFKNSLDPGKHTFDVVITLKENGIVTKTIRKKDCYIMVDMELVPEFTGITDPMIYNGILNGQSYTKKDSQIGTLSVKDVNDSDVTSYQIVSGGNGSLFKIDQKNKVYNTENLNAGTYTINLDITAKGITKQGTVTFKIEKAIPDISFKDDKTTKKSISDAINKWSEQASTSTFGTKITYAVSAGDVNLIDIDPDSGEITYKGKDDFGSVKIKATIDDDPTNDLDNYESSTVEKEIIIYREVGGYVQPDSKSSSIKDPTFTAADANIKSGGTIGMIIGESGTPDTIGGNTTTYTYDIDDTSTNANFFKVDKKSGEIKTTANLSTGTYNIVVTVSDKWSTKNIPVTINVGMAAAEDLKFYEDSSAKKAITKKSVAFTDKNVEVYAVVKDSKVANKVKYSIEDNSTNVITVNENTGAVEIKGVGKVTVVAKKAGATGQAEAVAKLEFEVTAGSFDFKYIDEAGDELGKTGGKYNAYKETYVKDKTFHIYTGGNPVGTTVTYDLKDKTEAMSDVISVDPDSGEVTILNASKTNQMGKIVIIATAHDPSGTYSDQSIELPVTIEKGTRVVSFADNPIYVASGKSSITPVIHVDGVPETEGKALISIDDTETDGTAWTDDNKTIKYEYNSEEPKDIKLKVTLPADRNYTIAEAEGALHIMGADENVLAITTPGRIIYGDHFTIKSTQDDSGSENVQYTFEVDDTTYVSTPTITGNKAEFDAVKMSGTNTATVTVTRTADGEVPLSKKVSIKVLPKPVEITIDHKEKLKGEQNPELTYEDFSSQLVSWNNVQDVIQPNDIKLSTTAKETSNASDYPIKGDSTTLNKAYPNYSFTFKENTLTIIEETIEDDWYHLELDDGNNTTYNGKWTNQNVNIVSDHAEYVNVSKDQSTWVTPQVTVSTEGKTEQSFWLKKDSGATTSEKKEVILIDQTPPTVKTITATDTNNKFQNIINQLTGGIFFKPGTTFEITTSDAKDDIDTSGTAFIDYKIYKQNDDKTYGSPIKQDTLTVSNEKAKVTIADTVGTYKICVLPKDNAGNVPEEEICKELTLKKIDVDIDGDGKDDFNDSDGDGCPDLNIVLGKDEDDEWIKLNIDNNDDGIPELNIDTNGDGIADINVDQDGDGIPDLNIVNVTTWNPSTCVTGQAEEYCTDGSLIPNMNVDLTGDGRPDINIDLNHDGIPDIDIDTDGDGKPDINLDTNKDGTADVNIKKMSEWKIDQEVFEVNGVKYQTMKGLIRDTLDQLEDNGVVLEPGNGSVILPNYAIKVTEVEDDEIKEDINKISGDQEVKKIYDVKFLKDNIETQPDGTMKIKIPIPEGVENPQLVVRKSDGSYEKLDCTVEDGYLVYETKEVGLVSILGDKEVIDHPDPEPSQPEPSEDPEPKDDAEPTIELTATADPKPTVQGTYTQTDNNKTNTGLGANMGGAGTGDVTNKIVLFSMLLGSLIVLYISKRRLRHK